jgi:hypothetical protein
MPFSLIPLVSITSFLKPDVNVSLPATEPPELTSADKFWSAIQIHWPELTCNLWQRLHRDFKQVSMLRASQS